MIMHIPKVRASIFAAVTVWLVASIFADAFVVPCRGKQQQVLVPPTNGYPYVILQNKELRVTVYTPDTEKGYYRGSRFDWSGIIGKVEYKGHVFYSQWRQPHDPSNPEHGIGPIEEYDIDNPATYSLVRPGESFIKIGVGFLIKPDQPEKYFFNMPYRIADTGPWKVMATKKCIEFSQSISHSLGYSYRLQKAISIDGNRLSVSRQLTNTGTLPIETEHYCHNFTSIDGDSIGPSYRLRLAFEASIPASLAQQFVGIAELADGVLTFLRPLNSYLFASFEGLKGQATENWFCVENIRTGATVTVTGDRAPSKFNLFAAPTALCPEPFVNISVKPGETVAWKTVYRFAVNEKVTPRTTKSGSSRGN